MDINEAASRLNDIYQEELRVSNVKYKHVSIGVCDNKILLYLDIKKLPPKSTFHGYEVIPIKMKSPYLL